MLGEAGDDLELVTPQSRESLHIETIRNKHRCSRPETPNGKLCSRSVTPSEKSARQDADRWYADFGADSTVTAKSLRDLRFETGTRVEDTTFASTGAR